MKKWIKVLLAVAAISAALSAILVKLRLDKKRKDELDAFLLPEEDDTMVVDLPNLDKDTEEYLA